MEIAKLQKAKSYLEALLSLTDPVTGESIADSVIEKREIRALFRFLTKALDELIENGGEAVQILKPLAFDVTAVKTSEVPVSDKPVTLSTFTSRINKQVDAEKMKRLGAAQISKWLIGAGYVSAEQVSVVRQETQLSATAEAERIGIVNRVEVDKTTGEVNTKLVFTKAAQIYLLQNLEKIVSSE